MVAELSRSIAPGINEQLHLSPEWAQYCAHSDTVIKSKFILYFFINFSFFTLAGQKEGFSRFVEPESIYRRRFFLRLFLLLHKRAERRLSLHHYPETIKSSGNFQYILHPFSIVYRLKLTVSSLQQLGLVF